MVKHHSRCTDWDKFKVADCPCQKDIEVVDGEELLRRINLRLCNVDDAVLAAVGDLVLEKNIQIIKEDGFAIEL